MTLKIDFVSDLHVDVLKSSPLNYAAMQKSDTIVVAGDVTSDAQETIAELKKIAAVYKTVLFVDGNHEFKHAMAEEHNFNIADTEDALRCGIAQMPNVAYLKDSIFIKDGVAIIGRNGHWDYSICPDITAEDALAVHAKQLGTDVKTLSGVFLKQAQQDFEDMRDMVVALNKNPDVHTIIAITHTAPRADALNPTSMPPERLAAMGNSLMKQVKDFDTGGKLKYWYFGHQHTDKTLKADGVTFICQPRGLKKRHNYLPLHLEIKATPPSFKPPATALPPPRPPKP